jgi:hypothetical protein
MSQEAPSINADEAIARDFINRFAVGINRDRVPDPNDWKLQSLAGALDL